jgi:hypothetical protein
MGEGASVSMASTITGALSTFTTDLTTVATSAIAVGAAGLLVWVGWRLACKLTNRGVGK